MRSIHRSQRSSARLLTALTTAFLLAACDREITREEAQAAGRPREAVYVPSPDPGPAGGTVGLNERGDVVGNAGGTAWRWARDGGVQPLDAQGGHALAYAMNEAGVAVGSLQAAGSWHTYPVRWGPDGAPEMLTEHGTAYEGQAIAVNDEGMVAGNTDGGFRSFVWTEILGLELLPQVGPYSPRGIWYMQSQTVVDINAAGDVLVNFTGRCENYPDQEDCFVEDPWFGAGVVKDLREVVLLQAPDEAATAHDLNDLGIAVGCSRGRPVVWAADGTAQVIPETGCAMAVNESGVVVGWRLNEFRQARAFRWTAAGGVEDLGTLGGSESRPVDLNEAGEVTGWSRTASGEQRGFVWRESTGMEELAPQPGDTWSSGLRINGAGEVAGTSGTAASSRAARWSGLNENLPPIAHPGGPYPTRIAGRRYAYSAAGSTDPARGALRFSWNMDGAGPAEGGGATPLFHFAYPAPGRYTLRLVVTNGGTRADTATAAVTVVANVAPAATLSGIPTSLAEGALLAPTVSVRDANQAADSTELSAMRYRWEWGDGTASLRKAGRHRYADQGSYTIRMIVTDAGGLADTVVRVLPVGNVAPTGRLTSPASIREGTPFTLTASALSDGPADVAAGLQVAFDCGGGKLGAFGSSLTIVCPARPDQGTVTVGMRVRDKDGAGASTTRAIPVGNVAPVVTASATSPTTLAAGGSLAVSGTFTDVGAGDAPWRYRIYWGDGSYTALIPVAAGATITGSHAYPKPGSYQAYVGVVDKDGGSGRSATIVVTVTP